MKVPNSIEGQDATVTPLRSSLQYHPIKINLLCQNPIDLETVSMNGFMTEVSPDQTPRNASSASSAINYIPTGSVDPNSAKKYQIVSDTEKLRTLCKLFEVESDDNDSVASLISKILKIILKRMIIPLNLMSQFFCGMCGKDCKKDDTYYHQDIMEHK